MGSGVRPSWEERLPCSGNELPVTAILALPDPAEEDNHMGWFCVEDDGNQIKKERHPLLVGRMPVTVAKQQEFKVTGRGPRPSRG